MKKYLLVAALGLSLTACSKAEEENDVTPAAITTAFDQDFSLSYRQQATVSPASSQPELTVAVENLHYKFCPKNAYCSAADFVVPTLSVTDSRGQVQQITISRHLMQPGDYSTVDTVSVVLDNQRYLLYHYYTQYEVSERCEQPKEKDISVKLRISKVSKN